MQMKPLGQVAAIAGLAALSACSGNTGATPPPVKNPVNPVSPSYSKLQFAVGTANIAGTPGLNTVVTLRQPGGLSAVGYSTPAITWDGNFTNMGATTLDGSTPNGPAPNVDDNLKQITGTLPVTLGTTAPVSTFGQGTGSWGAFGLGFYPANSGPGNVNSTITYPCLPEYGSFGSAPIAGPGCTGGGALYIGGPPAFPEVQNGSGLAGQNGATFGFTPFLGVTPAPNPSTGTSVFTLKVQVPTGFSGSTPTYGSLTATSTMTGFAPLGTFAMPTLTPLSSGGATIAYALPAGVTEAYLLVVNLGPAGDGSAPNCNFGASTFYYTVHVTATSPNPVGLGYNGGPNDPGNNLAPTPVVGSLPAGKSTKTFCSAADNMAATGSAMADQYVVYAVGFDYPAYGMSYPTSSGNQAPPIAGTNGQADLTMSAVSAASAVPFANKRAPFPRALMRHIH